MKKLLNKKISLCSLLFVALLLPHHTFASSVYMETTNKEVFVGDTILIDVRVDSEGREINTVKGKIFLSYSPDAVLVKDISLSESGFSLWPDKPLLSDDLKSISYTGGIPNGLQEQDATIFKIALSLTEAGSVTLSSFNTYVYLNDGKGTKVPADASQNLTIDVLSPSDDYKPRNDLEDLIAEDKTPPLAFEIVPGQDNSVFEGKKFLSFSTVDEKSGVKYYEVIEGNLPPTRSNGTYILQNQDEPTKVTVVAYDAAGNKQKSVYIPVGRDVSYAGIITIVGIILLAILLFMFFRRKRRRKNK